MKTRFLILAVAMLLSPSILVAQSYSINWYKVAGGGVTSTGGLYSVSSTVGQHDASGRMTGGAYSLTGGFWALYAVQTPGAPTLTITRGASGQATISWTPATPGFVLQENTAISPSNWTNSPSGATNPITVLAVPPRKFYRLSKP